MIKQSIPAAQRAGKIVHHINPLLGHPIDLTRGRVVSALFPLGGLPAAIHSGSWNRHIYQGTRIGNRTVSGAHNAAHIRLMRQERGMQSLFNRYTMPTRATLDVYRPFGNH